MDIGRLKAAGFSDQEIKLHQAGFSDDEIQAAQPTQQAAPPATFMSTLARAAGNLPQDAINTAASLSNAGDQFLQHPLPTIAKAASAAANAASSLQLDTQPFNDAMQSLKDKYGSKQAIYKTIGDHPVAPLLAAASFAIPALRATGLDSTIASGASDALTAIGNSMPGNVLKPATDVVGKVALAGQRANTSSAAMRAQALAQSAGGQADAEAAAQAATDRAARVQSISQRAQTQSAALAARSTDAAATATPPDLNIGDPAHLSDMGDAIRAPALANQAGIEANMRAADTKYRSALNAVADDRAAAGVGVSDGPAAQALIKNSQGLVEPDPVARATVGYTPSPSAGGGLHSGLLDALRPKEIPLTVAQGQQAVAQGLDVQRYPNGNLYRIVKPNYRQVDNFRRLVGKAANGTPLEGYGAINQDEAGDMYRSLNDVLDEYADGASAPVRANWAAGKQALAPFDNVRAGQSLVGMQPGTNVPSVPAAAIPGRILSGGRDAMQQAATVAGPAPVASIARSQVQNALKGVTGSDAIAAKVAPGTRLGDVVNADSDLSSAVSDYIAKTKAAETQGTTASSLSQRADNSAARAQKFSDMASTLQGTAASATDTAGSHARDFANLEIADPKSVGSLYTKMLNTAHAAGTLSTPDYARGLQLAASAQKDFALKTTRDRWLIGAAGVLGLGQFPKVAHSVWQIVK